MASSTTASRVTGAAVGGAVGAVMGAATAAAMGERDIAPPRGLCGGWAGPGRAARGVAGSVGDARGRLL
ncbi:MAG: hypothetical protein IT332_10260 [Ardenticatenales bacterium]|nr:hypothetical protein [Ardenticatenales bacterium]